jgi:dTDP-4-dehydrorhamnose 3,5-epimerase-like enzyme
MKTNFDNKNISIYNLKLFKDHKGELCVGEFLKDVPFIPKRFFFIYNVPYDVIRGAHSHINCHQFLICIRGSVIVTYDNGKSKFEVKLNSATKGIYIPPLVWSKQYNYSNNSLLLVFASHEYEEKDYIRNYDQFLKRIKNNY